ncbi:uncharacterized protein J4E84_006266 [Alternaria hordeiaustralica]|uniref:uncharacterized protein n=1 Tax=Alternaria hordeiaustralica TaxID=1187925 RepID=UPI0020C4C6DE|nr:uncharacterized protein J4E84_006266 [Alternaria hordeiaustralica]KAI4685538.1 hypothetical protein J4E84_006266 [Alternaria hordeiaustralica]
MRQYLDHGHGTTERPLIMFGQSGQGIVGLYIGENLLNQGMSSALRIFEDSLANPNVSAPSSGMQLCGPEYDSADIFGIMVTSNATFTPSQNAIKTWANATCLPFSESSRLSGQATFVMPLLAMNGTANATMHNNATRPQTQKRHSRHIAYHTNRSTLNSRAECKVVQVESGDSCAALAAKCGISPTDFTKHNSAPSFCAKLKPKQRVCCSSGSLPDFSPKPNTDGSCHAYQVKTNDNCDNLAAEYSLTRQDLEDFNKKTWGWNGCKLLFIDTIMCLSTGTPPFPAPIANAVCGPQKPGSKPPTTSTKIADLNPCPLNACCNIWGQCGITKEFCVDTNTGAPGTAKPGTYGCISNCGTDIVRGNGNGGIKIAYFEGYGMTRECLFQDASQIDTSQYTHVHFAFGTLTSNFEVEVGDKLSTYNFGEFKRIKGAKKILSFGGWAFSTEPATYSIFRDGVTSANRMKMAVNIALFIEMHDLDGVDIDWEYPGAPDIPGIPPASKADGPNYLAFLAVLRNLLPSSKTVSICAPSSYWYLKQYPIESIGRVVDYIVYMTYDLHGQWDAGNAHSQEGCDSGNCLRSQVNLTETKQSLAMITKAGVPGNKVIVGVTSYGRSFNMAEAGCWGADCLYTGSQMNSDATKGKCTNSAGYIADAEIAEIIEGQKRAGRVVQQFLDTSSNSDVLVYDDTQWVSYMSSKTKQTRSTLYSAWGLGGTTDWATDLQTFNDVPKPAKSWADFKLKVKSGESPYSDDSRNGDWTTHDCTDKYIEYPFDYPHTERWKGLDTDGAWKDIVRIWRDNDVDRDENGIGSFTFSNSITNTLKISTMECGDISLSSNCASTGGDSCPKGLDGPLSGAAGSLIFESILTIHNMYMDYKDAILDVASTMSFSMGKLMVSEAWYEHFHEQKLIAKQNTFAPIKKEDDTILLLLIDLVTLGTLSIAGPFFNNIIKNIPYFKGGSAFDNAKDTTMNLIGQSTTIAKDVKPSKPDEWNEDGQNAFADALARMFKAWADVAKESLKTLFNGSDPSIAMLWDTMSDGKLITGRPPKSDDQSGPRQNASKPALRDSIEKSVFAFAIPALWRNSNRYAFVMDSGYGCGDDKALSDYLSDDTMRATGACIDGKQYYLVHPDGDASKQGCVFDKPNPNQCDVKTINNKFSTPPGLGSLDGAAFGRVTKEDLIKGSVRTYVYNGKKNVIKGPNVDDKSVQNNLLDGDITAPGFIQLPVCSPERAFQSWDSSSKGSSTFYPCDLPPGKDHCGETTFENQGSDASPKVEDCRQIIKNIQGDGNTEWTVQTAGLRQRAIAKASGCSFGVEATNLNGNIDFEVGGQDVIDVINEAIQKFGGGGRIGAKGEMKCRGNVVKQNVKWGIY